MSILRSDSPERAHRAVPVSQPGSGKQCAVGVSQYRPGKQILESQVKKPLLLLLAIFSGIILFGQIAGKVHVSPDSEYHHIGDMFQSASGKDCASPGHLPFLPQSEESESEAQETLDLSESNLADGNTVFYPSRCFVASFERIAAAHFTASFQNRDLISLYVLHHAWRSHLS